MKTVIQQAAAGKRSAMEQLYNHSRQKVFYLSYHLLRKQDGAEIAVNWVYKNIWTDGSLNQIKTEEEFTSYAVRKTIEYCKKQVRKHNSKAFDVPQGRNFVLSGPFTYFGGADTPVDKILAQFTPLQRFVFVSHIIEGYDAQQLAKIMLHSVNTIEMVMDAERENVELVLKALKLDGEMSYEDVVEMFSTQEKVTAVPQQVDKQAFEDIGEAAAPGEKRAKKIKMTAAAVVAVLCLCAAGAAAMIPRVISGNSPAGINQAGNSADPLDGADNTASEGTDNSDADSSENTENTGTEDGDIQDGGTENDPTETEWVTEVEHPTHYAKIEIEGYGTITVALDGNTAPETVNNFVKLAENGFYDGLTFHRIIEGFMMQGGDPNGDGSGGSNEKITGEFSENGYDNHLSHVRGAISMARSSDYNSASSQFFIVQKDTTSLDGSYAAFGYVTEGMEIVDAICEAAEPTDNNGTIAPEEQPVITGITIITN